MARGSMGGGPGRQLSKAGAMASRNAPRVASSRRTRPSAPSPGRAWARLRRRSPGSRWVGLPGRRFAASGRSDLRLVAVILQLFSLPPKPWRAGGLRLLELSARARAAGRGDSKVRPYPVSYPAGPNPGLVLRGTPLPSKTQRVPAPSHFSNTVRCSRSMAGRAVFAQWLW